MGSPLCYTLAHYLLRHPWSHNLTWNNMDNLCLPAARFTPAGGLFTPAGGLFTMPAGGLFTMPAGG